MSTPNTNSAPSDVAALTPRVSLLSNERIVATTSTHRVAHPTSQQTLKLRPELQSAKRALREMPPFARAREIETGRYSHFSPEERELLRSLDYTTRDLCHDPQSHANACSFALSNLR
jgi:hypothetical protein